MAWHSGSFDYGHTCPDIDKSIQQFKNILNEELQQLVLLEKDEIDNEVINSFSESIYNEFEQYFEAVRSTNDDMRKEAEIQISNLKDEIENLKNQVSTLEFEIAQL